MEDTDPSVARKVAWMKNFTDKMIQSLKSEGKPYIVREQAPRGEGGFCIRVMPSGAKTWQMIYTFQGKRKWYSLGQYPFLGLKDARQKFKDAKALLEQGEDPGAKKRAIAYAAREEKTVDELCDAFLTQYASVEKRANSAKQDRLNLERDVRKKIGGLKLSEVTRGDLQGIINDIVGRKAKVQAQRTRSTIRKMFAWAHEEELIKDNPAQTIRAPKSKSEKIRELNWAEIITLFKGIDNSTTLPRAVGIVLKLILLTGCRPNEAIAIFRNFTKGERWITLTASMTKNKIPHRVYLTDFAHSILSDDTEDLTLSSNLEFTIKNYTLSAWVRKLNYLGLEEPWTPHDLRRTCATRLAELRTPPHIIQRILNHQQKTITDEVYNLFLYTDEISAALESLSTSITDSIKS
jgi:integrase